jgi:hypothetical protein
VFFLVSIGNRVTYEAVRNTTVESLESQGFRFFEIRDFGMNTPAHAGVFMKDIDRGTHVTRLVRLLVCPD